MGTRRLERVRRSGPLSLEEAARDRELRRKIQEEFPPARPPSPPAPNSLSEILRRAIRESNRSVYELAKEAGISQIMISRFLSGERDIRLATADKLAGVLELTLTVQ
jgi:ribosome-binding protein aMBF1 (putative translation factor)